MRVIIATTQIPFVQGGAEVLASDLLAALSAEGHEAEIVAIPFSGNPPERILDQMLACRLLDLTTSNGAPVDRLIALKFPVYLAEHPRKALWLLHQYRAAYDLFDYPLADLKNEGHGLVVRDAIRAADGKLIRDSRAVFTISQNVSARLQRYNGIDSIPLYPPIRDEASFHCAEKMDDYLFFPSRLTPPKRQELVLRALAHCPKEVRVVFAGLPDNHSHAERLKSLAAGLGVERQAEWRGRITQHEKLDAYSRCIAVVFPPLDEDYGYVTLEAMLSEKAVITCTDSGGPTEFVRHEESGLIAEPAPEALGHAFERLWRDRELAAGYGREGRATYLRLGLSWPKVVTALLA